MLLSQDHLIRPTAYFVRAFDTNPNDRENRFEDYTVQFKCGSCGVEVESERLMRKGERVRLDAPLNGIDRAEFFARCVKLSAERDLGTPFLMEQGCPKCHKAHLILFGATEWQPTRDVIEIGGIYLVD